jgi:hypothetical protein
MVENPKSTSRIKDGVSDISRNLHQKYDNWLSDMAKRSDAELVPFDFDVAKHPEQDVNVSKIEAVDPYFFLPDFIYYAALRRVMSRSMGGVAVGKLLSELKSQPTSSENDELLIETLKDDQKLGKNTMFVTSHFSFSELGYFKALRFYAKKDRPNSNRGGVLLNKLMTRQSLNGKKLVEMFVPFSNVYFSYPKSASAVKFNIPNEIMRMGNVLVTRDIIKDLKNGGLEMDVALTGKQIMAKRDEAGRVEKYIMPEIDSSSVGLVGRFDNIIGATLIRTPEGNDWMMKIGDLIDIKSSVNSGRSLYEIVAMVYDDIVASVENFTQKEVDSDNLFRSLGRSAIK